MLKKVLITGGCGFIGSNLTHALVELGHSVRVLDDLSTGKKNILPHDVEFLEGTLVNKEQVIQALEGVDICYHLGAVASVEKSIRSFSQTTSINLLGTVHLLEAISKMAHPIPFVYASSAAVYADHSKLPLDEGLSPLPASPYGADKGAMELYARASFEAFNIPSIGFRLFNVYGPGQDPTSPYSGVISIFCDKLLSGEKISIFGDGKQKRDFIHVSDVICYFIKALEKPLVGSSIYNLCTGDAISINTLIKTLEKISGKKIPRSWEAPRQGEARISMGDPTRAIRDFDIKPQCSLEEGLKSLLEYHEAHPCV